MRRRAPGGVVLVFVVASLALHVLWLVRFRRGYVTEWDESGYLQFSLSDFDALHDGGLWEFVKIVGGRGTFGPLLPAVTALAYPLVTRGVFGSLLALLPFYALLVGATYGLARRLVGGWWAAAAAIAVGGMPAALDYTRLFHFALPATACLTAALWALVESEALERRRWAVAFGAFAGLMLLSRTMTLAFLPGLALAGAVQLAATGSELRNRVRNLALAAAAAVVVAGPWYLANARSVYDLYSGLGYGEGATPFGRHYPVASWGYWTKELRLVLSYLLLPLALVVAVALVAAAASCSRRLQPHRPRSTRAVALLALALVVGEGYLVLTSSRNEGTAFPLPWLPALVVLGVVAAASLRSRSLHVAFAAAFVTVGLLGVASKSGSIPLVASVRSVALPGLGDVGVTDGRGIIQREVEGDGYSIGQVTHPMAVLHKDWLPVARRVVGSSLARAARRHEPLNLMLGLDDRILGNSRLELAAQLWYHRYVLVDYLHPLPDTVASYRTQLVSPRRVNALVTGEPPPNGSAVTRRTVESAARSLGFVRIRSFASPDGRRLWLWWR